MYPRSCARNDVEGVASDLKDVDAGCLVQMPEQARWTWAAMVYCLEAAFIPSWSMRFTDFAVGVMALPALSLWRQASDTWFHSVCIWRIGEYMALNLPVDMAVVLHANLASLGCTLC